jgi:APA family basic amino acid/polyamine antiporter
VDREPAEVTLRRDLGPWAAASIVVGTIIGTGVFLKTAVMARTGGSALWVLAAWGVAGLLSFTGALTYAELGGMFPRAGGEYVFLREGFGAGPAYLYAWNRFWIGTPASVAAYAVGTATFVDAVWPLGAAAKPVAVALVVAITVVNCLRVLVGGFVQTALTIMKVVMILGLVVGALAFARGGDLARVTDTGHGFPGFGAFGAMVLAALWAYDGWNNLPMAAGEVREPQRNLPRAIIWGSLAVLVIYALVNIGYFNALPFADVASSKSVAQATAATFLGQASQVVLALAMAISAVSAMNGSTLTGARVPYAVALDGLAPRAFARVSAVTRVPIVAVVVQGVVAAGYALVGGFDELTDAVVFVSWLFYALNAGTVLRLRVRAPDHARPFRVPGYPIVPLVFIALSALLIGNALWATPRASALGAGATALGAIVYVLFYRVRA